MNNNTPMYDDNDMKKIFSMAAQYMGVEYDEEITKAGFDLREFYAEYDFDNAEENEEDLEV